jgi:hypothetical protein
MPAHLAAGIVMHRSLLIMICAALLLAACDRNAEEHRQGAVEKHAEDMRNLAERTGAEAEAAIQAAKARTDRAIEEAERGD